MRALVEIVDSFSGTVRFLICAIFLVGFVVNLLLL